MADGAGKRRWREWWHWAAMALLAGVAVWHYLDWADAVDLDFPMVVRPHFSPHPPAAYRLSEPGDTLDRIGLYLAAAALATSLAAMARVAARRRAGGADSWALWPAAAAGAAAGVWHSATPGPAFDGWHGLGWRAILDPSVPSSTRATLALAAAGLAMVAAINLVRAWPERHRLLATARQARALRLLALAPILIALRQVAIPGVEPAGYWPRCSYDLGFLAFALALIRLKPGGELPIPRRGRVAVVAGWAAVVVGGITLATYHRPIARLHAVVPGKIYIGAMPTYRGLAIEQERLHFRTIINLFDEASTQASPIHEDEIRFVREHGLRYLGSPSDGLESDRFLDETFALARNPDAWPILVHCHGCMDRSPAWMGMYRFLFEGVPLADVYREIEQHRGTRPKAVVTLQYNRKLPRRDADRYEADPTSAILRACVAGTKDPFGKLEWNPFRTDRQVVRRIEPGPAAR